MIQINVFKIQKQTHRLREWTYGWGRRLGEGIVREFGMDMYTLLYLKWITNKDLLYSTWNSAQCYAAAWMRGDLGENRYMYTHGWVPSLCTWNYPNIINQLSPNTKEKVFLKRGIQPNWKTSLTWNVLSVSECQGLELEWVWRIPEVIYLGSRGLEILYKFV